MTEMREQNEKAVSLRKALREGQFAGFIGFRSIVRGAAEEIERQHSALTAAQAEVERLQEENARLRLAFHDAIRRPMGVIPGSGVEFFEHRLVLEAMQRRPRRGSPEDMAERRAAPSRTGESHGPV